MFTTLPPEILGMIFKSVRKSHGSQQTSGAICKQLLPYTRANLYDNIRISSPTQFISLLAAISATSHQSSLGHLVTELTLEDVSLKDSLVSSEQLAAFFRQLSHTSKLIIARSTRLASSVLSLDSTYLPDLYSLELKSVLEHLDPPFEGDSCAARKRYSRPDSFTTHLGPPLREEVLCATEASCTPPARHLRTLILEGDFTTHDPVALLAYHPNIYTLRLADQSITPKLNAVLAAAHLPKLVELELRSDNSKLSIPLPLELSLRHFYQLRHLILGRSTFSSSLFDTLSSQLPHLSHLTFLLGAEVSSDALASLFEGPMRLNSLKKITFDNVAGSLGPAIVGNTYYSDEEEYYSDSDYSATNSSTYPGWKLPIWTTLFSKEDARRTLELARRNGIEVGGTLLNAISVDDEWTREWEKAQVYEKGAWHDLR